MSEEERAPGEGNDPEIEFRPPTVLTAVFAVSFIVLVVYAFLG